MNGAGSSSKPSLELTGPPGTESVQTLWQSHLPIASISEGPVSGRVDVTYNDFLETELLEVTGGHRVRYTYDRDGLVTRAADASSPTGPALQLTRAALDGHVEQDVLGVVQTEYAVDVSAATPSLDAPVADYGYDLNGNRTSVVEPGRVLELGVNLGCADSGRVPLARGANDRDELCRHGDYDYEYDANGRLQTRGFWSGSQGTRLRRLQGQNQRS